MRAQGAGESPQSTRVRLVEAMMSLDDHRSVQEHTVAELAAIAGVAKGSVYYQFGSKEELVREMLVHGSERLQQRMQLVADSVRAGSQACATHPPSPALARETLTAELTEALVFLGDHPSFTGLLAFVLARRREDESGHLRAEKQAVVDLLSLRLQQIRQAQPEHQEAAGTPQSRTSSLSVRDQMAATALLSSAVTLSIERHTERPQWSIADCVTVLMGLVDHRA